MPLNRLQITRLQKFAEVQPVADAVLFWFFVWIFITCGLLWFFAEQAFPVYDGAQGVTLSWVGALIAAGGVIAALLCYILYKYLMVRKQAAVNELKELFSDHRTDDV